MLVFFDMRMFNSYFLILFKIICKNVEAFFPNSKSDFFTKNQLRFISLYSCISISPGNFLILHEIQIGQILPHQLNWNHTRLEIDSRQKSMYWSN